MAMDCVCEKPNARVGICIAEAYDISTPKDLRGKSWLLLGYYIP